MYIIFQKAHTILFFRTFTMAWFLNTQPGIFSI